MPLIVNSMNSTENFNMSEFSEPIVNSATNHSGNCTPNLYRDYYYRLAENIYFYGLLVIIPVGLIGNFFSICIFLLSVLRRTTTGQYLVALAIADSTVLIGDAIRWLASRRHNVPEYYVPQYLGLNFVDTSNAACKITNFLRYGGNLWSVWLTIAISVERLIAVAFPLHIGRLSTPTRTRIVIASIGVVSFLLGSFAFWTLHADFSKTCGVAMPHCKIEDKEAYKTWNTAVVKFCTLLIPGLLITVFTTVIITLLYRARHQRTAHLNASMRIPREGGARLGVSVETQLTIMLVAVCVSTIALRGPYTIAYYVRFSVWEKKSVDAVTDVETYMASRITDMINTINYAINFVLYCLCGSSFRGEASKIFCKERKTSAGVSAFATEEVCLSSMRNQTTGSKSATEHDR